MKKCTKCKEVKGLASFHKLKSSRDGLQCWCKDCMAYWRKANKGSINKRGQKWRKDNPEASRCSSRESYRRNADTRCQRIKDLRNRSFKFRINDRYAQGINGVLFRGRKSASVFVAMGYSKEELKCHIESLFQVGMNWGNHGEWHIDHVIPKSFFKYESTDDVEFKMCWRLENLQPLWAADNRSKKDKLPTALAL